LIAEPPLARSAGAAGIATLISRILGVVRDQVVLAVFGAGNDMDAFTVAFRIPNLVRDLFAEGAMSAAFVPAFTRHVTLEGRPAAWRLANNVITALAIATIVLVVVGMILARPLASAFAGDYATIPGKLELTIHLTRIMLPFLTLAAIAAAMMGMLNSLHHYFMPALSPATFNVATIVAAVALPPVMIAAGLPAISSIAIGAVAGGVTQILVQWRALHREGFRYRPVVDWRDPALRRILALMGPGTIGMAATQVNVFVNTLLATSEGTGAATWLTYAFRLMYLPIGLFGVSIATVVLPAAARHAALKDLVGIRQTVSRGLGLMLALNVPATIGLLALAVPIVRVLFEHGRFLPSDTEAVAAAVRFYALGLVGYSAARISSPMFYALGRNRVPVIISVAAVAVNIAASLALVGGLGFRGLALATSIAAMAHGAALLILLRGELGGLEGNRLAATLVKSVGASAAMAAAARATHAWVTQAIQDQNTLAQVSALALAIAAGVAVLAITAKLLRIAEFDEAVAGATAQARKLLSR
jgi:putative peptidoglycan lipid II flippase